MVRTFFALGCLMLCLGLFSCYDENGTYGSDLVDSAFRNVRIDTSTVGVFPDNCVVSVPPVRTSLW